jgi:cytochrome P450
MATLAPHQSAETAPSHWQEGNPGDDALAHIPGEGGWPIVGNTFKMLADPHGQTRRMVEKYGRVYKNKAFGGWNVALIGAEANEMLLMNRDKIFSSEQGWGPILDKLFPRGLMLIDFDHHRADRRALSIAFKPGPMRHYADALNRGIAKRVEEWGGDGSGAEMLFYPSMVQASVAPVRKPLPFTQMKRGVDGRAFLVDYFTRETHRRRAEGGGQDMFSQFATAEYDDGSLMPVDEVVDHMNFLMMAAHDTITSSATSLLWLLAKHPEWQDRLREEIAAVTGGSDASGRPRDLEYDDLGKLDLTEMAFKEALRFVPPVPSMPRRALKSFEYGGYRIPAGAHVGINIHYTHHDEEHWEDPYTFDPMRFTPEQVKTRHKYAWVPFGGGAHMCLGLHFAYMQVKILLAQMLPRYRIELAAGDPEWQAWPIPKPKDGLKLKLTAI